MIRKIVQHGCSSLTITLPYGWVKKFGLKKGDELNVIEEDSNLVIFTKAEKENPKKEVDVTEFGYFTKNNLTHLYQLGYDELEIGFEDEKSLRDIKDRISECIGYEIIDQKPKKIVIKSIASTLESEFDTLLRKSFLITNEMANAVLDALKNRQFSKLKEIRHHEFLNNKFTMTCVRILNKRGYKNPKRNMQIYNICKCLERTADYYKYMCDLLFDYNNQINKETLDFFEAVNRYYYTFYQIFYKFDPELKEIIYKERKKLLEQGERLLAASKGKESTLIHYLLTQINIIYDAAGEYFAILL